MKKNLIYTGMIAAFLAAAVTESKGQAWTVNGNAGTLNTNFLGTTDSKDLRIKTKNVARIFVSKSGPVGIGNTAPKSRLDILGGTGNADTIPAVNVIVKKTGNFDVVGVHAESQPAPGYGIGIDGFGNFIGVSGFGAEGGDFQSAGADTTVANTGTLIGCVGAVNTAAAAVGVFGAADNGNFAYGVYGTTNGGGFTDTASTKHWALYGDGDVFGVRFFQASDAKLKENIKPITSATEKLMQLTPSTYNFKSNTGLVLPSGKEYGLLSDNVEKVFPELIKEARTATRFDRNHNKIGQEISFKSVNYSGLIPVLVESAKEQQTAINAKNAQIADLSTKITALENRLAALENTSSAKLSSVSSSDAALEQNSPNPFNQSTQIRYSVPANSSAQIIITSVDGKSVRNYAISGSGKGQITLNASELSAGSYTYSLNVNGKVIDSKTMVLTK
ncbi:MAG: tail fiber domain-containing protein [Bacteroidia bacterium]